MMVTTAPVKAATVMTTALLLLALFLSGPPALAAEDPAAVPLPETVVREPLLTAPEGAESLPQALPEKGREETTAIESPLPAEEPADSSDVAAEEGPRIADPFAPTNRIMFELNDRLYFWVLKPVTRAYARIPEDLRVVFSNIYDNLKAPGRALNNLLQLRLKGAGNELLRFVLNSTVGVGGIGDAARDAFGIPKQEADFGQTLGHYGLDHGFYLVWPVLGPSSLRDTVGRAGDYFMYPLTYVHHEDLSTAASLGLGVHELINAASFRTGDYETFKAAALDPYIAMRDAFVQNRKKKVQESMQQQ